MPCAMSSFQKLCPAPFPPVSCSFPEPRPGPQCCLYNLLEGQPENSWSLEGNTAYYAIPLDIQPSSSMFPTTCATSASLSEPAGAGDRHTMSARSPSVGGIPSRAIGLTGIMAATLGVSPAGPLGPNPYHPSPKHTPGSNLHPLLWNTWSVASYQFVLKPITNSYNQDPSPL